jgi:hypothetical protein
MFFLGFLAAFLISAGLLLLVLWAFEDAFKNLW